MAPPLFHRSSYCFRNSFCKLLFFIFFFCFLGYYLELRYDMYFSVLYRQFNRQRRLRICNAANYWPLEGPSRTCFVNPTQKIAPKEGPKKCKKAPIVAKLKKTGMNFHKINHAIHVFFKVKFLGFVDVPVMCTLFSSVIYSTV